MVDCFDSYIIMNVFVYLLFFTFTRDWSLFFVLVSAL